MKKIIFMTTLALLLAGCGANPISNGNSLNGDNSGISIVGNVSTSISEQVSINASTSSNSDASFQLSLGDAPVLTGYYAAANGLTGAALRTSLYNIISSGYKSGSYSTAQSWLKVIDKKANGTMWDIYSDVPNGTPPYTFSPSKTCGSYQKEGDCWNREHIVPQSVFSEASPMVSDVHHLFATDGYVNGRRSNYPFGEVQSATWTSQNGSKVGSGKSSIGYTSTVFEPIDEYKGDVARAVMYMVVRYQNVMNGWGSFAMFDKSSGKLGLSTWGKNLLLKWNQQDPVSEKEITRNNQIYNNYQKNRNPFVDYPALAPLIWAV